MTLFLLGFVDRIYDVKLSTLIALCFHKFHIFHSENINLQILEALLPKGMIVPSSFETVGHIAHLNLKDEHLHYKHLIAKVSPW